MFIQLSPGAPVTVVCAAGASPVLAPASVVSSEADSLVVELASDVTLPPRARVIVELPPGLDAPRLTAHVASASGRRLTLRGVGIPERDRREYPRLEGFVRVRYRVAHGDDAARWARGETPASPERTPDPFMNFSATGVAFVESAVVHEGELLLLHLSLPGAAPCWRCTARVVRVLPLPADEREPGEAPLHSVAVFFEEIPAEATVALARYTLQIQDALLGPARPTGD